MVIAATLAHNPSYTAFLRCSNDFEIDTLPETNSSDLKMDGWMMVEIL